MQRAWMQGQITTMRSSRPQAVCGGAVGSILAALTVVGWTSPSFDTVTSRDGAMLDLDAVAPKTVERFLFDDD